MQYKQLSGVFPYQYKDRTVNRSSRVIIAVKILIQGEEYIAISFPGGNTFLAADKYIKKINFSDKWQEDTYQEEHNEMKETLFNKLKKLNQLPVDVDYRWEEI